MSEGLLKVKINVSKQFQTWEQLGLADGWRRFYFLEAQP